MALQFRSRALSAWEQYKLLKCAESVLPAVLALSSSGGLVTSDRVSEVLAALTDADPDEADALFKTCIGCTEVRGDDSLDWSPVDDDVSFKDLLRLVVSVVCDNLGDYLAHRKFKAKSDVFNAPPYVQASLPDKSDWFWRPLDDHMCSYEALVDGRLRLIDVARMNDVIAVREENLRLHAEHVAKNPGR